MRRAKVVVNRLADERSGRVVFLSHCLLNQNTRYLGGAFRPGAVDEVVEPLPRGRRRHLPDALPRAAGMGRGPQALVAAVLRRGRRVRGRLLKALLPLSDNGAVAVGRAIYVVGGWDGTTPNAAIYRYVSGAAP